MPGETRAYVRTITGRPAEEWARASNPDQLLPNPAERFPCVEVARALPPGPAAKESALQNQTTPPRPWGLQLIGDSSEARALAEFRQLQKRHPAILGHHSPVIVATRLGLRGSGFWFRVRVAETTREQAMTLCAQLQADGGQCLVVKNAEP